MKFEQRWESRQIAAGWRLVCLLLVLSALIGCGKKGPLYLPPDKMPKATPVPVSTAVPASHSSDNERNKKAKNTDVDKPRSTTIPITTPQL